MTFQILLFAFIEEMIKVLVVRSCMNTINAVASIFLFAVLEGIFDLPIVSAHLEYLGASIWTVFIGSFFILFCSKFLHVATSYIYLRTKFLKSAVVFCTLWHASYNSFIDSLPTFELKYYIFIPVLFFASDIIIAYLYLTSEKAITILKSR
ncbi:hypothetical protein DUT91_25060 [Phyllobacterium salinisoli]|uniref:Uncharacterized protein n=1 Tax=Phyllobacterium salinisoli TaxID=1899321 RepID=A0A368JVW0_9HYPH|nr:hypothetical protein DUT91_25060 [Phyllobacterium salinisoli]